MIVDSTYYVLINKEYDSDGDSYYRFDYQPSNPDCSLNYLYQEVILPKKVRRRFNSVSVLIRKPKMRINSDGKEEYVLDSDGVPIAEQVMVKKELDKSRQECKDFLATGVEHEFVIEGGEHVGYKLEDKAPFLFLE